MEAAESWGNDTERPRKRNRIALACEACRTRKVRCDGLKPVCTPCQKRGKSATGCVYAVIAQTAKYVHEQEYIASLQQQIQELNQVVDDLKCETRQAQDITSQCGNNVVPSAVANVDTRAWASDSPGSSLRGREGQSTASELRAAVGDHNSPISAMGATTVLSSNAVRNDEFYGQSSVHSLLRELPYNTEPHVQWADGTGTAQDQSPLMQAEYALPPRKVADELLRLYFDNAHIFYPWTHSFSFLSRYETLWTSQGYPGIPTKEKGDIGLGGNKCPLSTFLSALNAMFALGCEFSTMPQRQSASAVFASRMKILLQAELLDHDSLSHCQALLIAGHFLFTTDHATRCYNILGLACRMAVGIGLHSNRHAGRRTVVENEIRRRTWYGCLQMEMTVCMTLGRPPLLQVSSDVPLPASVDDMYIIVEDDICQQPEGTISVNNFTVHNIRLARILGRILDDIYCRDASPSDNSIYAKDAPNFNTVVYIDSLLDECKESLPDSLKWDNGLEHVDGADSVIQRQRNVLRARFLHLRILLYRPSFSSFFALTTSLQNSDVTHNTALDGSSSRGHELNTAFRDQCAKICLHTVYDLVASVEAATQRDATGAWWFSLLYLITCGGILILAECSQISYQLFDQEKLDSAWQSCITTLGLIGKDHRRAHRYQEHLCRLRDVARSACSSSRMLGVPSRRPSTDALPTIDDLANWNPDPPSDSLFGILDTDFITSTIFNDMDWSFGNVPYQTDPTSNST